MEKSPYYAVVFKSEKIVEDPAYDLISNRIDELALKQKGFLGIDTVYKDGKSLSVSYWETLDDIRAWKQQADHAFAQKMGKEKWYKSYSVKICKVEHEYSFEK